MNRDFISKAIVVAIIVIVTALVVSYITGPMEINAVTTQKDALFEVSDTGNVFAKPDTATIQVAVVREGQSVGRVQTDLNEANNRVIDAIKNQGISEDDIKTVSYDISPKYQYNPETGQQRIDGYMATSRLEIRTTEFDKLNSLVDAVTKSGANEVGQVQFIVDERDQYVAQARKEAIEGAKKKAGEIAKEAGLDLGRLIDVQVYETGVLQPPVIFYEKTAGMGGGADTMIQPGTNEIIVTATLSYSLD